MPTVLARSAIAEQTESLYPAVFDNRRTAAVRVVTIGCSVWAEVQRPVGSSAPLLREPQART